MSKSKGEKDYNQCCSCKKCQRKYHDYYFKEYYVKKCHCRCYYELCNPCNKKNPNHEQ